MILLLATAFAADADPFRPSGSLASGRGTLQGESPLVLGRGFGFGLHGSLAQNLAVQVQGDQRTPLVRSVLPVELYGAYTQESLGLRIEAFAPVYLYTEAPVDGFRGGAMGDVRLQANLPLLRKDPRVAFGLVPRIELPTGTRRANTRRGFSGNLTATLGGTVGKVGWLTNVGLTVSGADELAGVGMGSAVEFLGGGWYEVTPGFRVGAEAEAQVGLVKRALGRNNVGTWHAFAQTRMEDGLGLTVGGGRGLINGVGAPSYRAFAALTWQPIHKDTDKDGLYDHVDDCPLEPEDFDAFEDEDGCPEADNDNDTIVDLRDDCPTKPEDFDGFRDDDGCPEADNDGDGVLDPDDRCPLEPGVPENQGCPAVVDTDGDGVLDPDDRCPEQPGPVELQGCPDRDGDRVPDLRDLCPDDPIPAEEDPATSDGCPKTVYITKDEIRITERILFETGKSKIRPESFGILDRVAQVMADNPNILKIEVAGHTDNVGSEKYNETLSQGRADAVRDYLQGKSIAADRLAAKGYGETRPRYTNRTEDGRSNNRRVEFKLVKVEGMALPATPEPTQAPVPGPTPPSAPAPKPAPVQPAPVPAVVQPVPVPVPGPTPAPKPAFETSDLTDPWDKPAPKPAPAPAAAPVPAPDIVDPWGTRARPADPEPLTNPWGKDPAPLAPAPKGPSDLVDPWGTAGDGVTEADPAPLAPKPPAGTLDPSGAPGRLTIQLGGGTLSAIVYLDNEPLQRMAPLSGFPVRAGEYKLWVRSSDGTLNERTTLVIYNGMEAVLSLPGGGPPTYRPAEAVILPSPAPAGRKAKKRR